MASLEEIKSAIPFINTEEKKELKVLFLMSLLRDFANKFVLFFLPIYLFELGRTSELFNFLNISDLQKGIWAFAGYFIIFGTTGLLTGIWSANFLQKTSYGNALATSLLILGGQYLLLFSLNFYPLWWLWAVAAAVDGFQSAMYWQSLQSLLSKYAKRAKMGKHLGSLQLLTQLVTVIGPAVSGTIALYAGIHTLFLIGLATSVMAAVSAAAINRTELHDKVSFREFSNWLKEKRFRILALSNAGKSINDDVSFVWPLYIFLLLGSIDSVGYLYTLSLFLALLATMFTGAYVDKNRSKKPFYASGGVLFLVWMAKTRIINPIGIAVADAIDRLAANIHTLFFDTFYMRRGKGSNALSFFTYRKMVTNATQLSFWSIFGLIFMIFSSWITIFVLAGIGVLVSLLVKENIEETDQLE